MTPSRTDLDDDDTPPDCAQPTELWFHQIPRRKMRDSFLAQPNQYRNSGEGRIVEVIGKSFPIATVLHSKRADGLAARQQRQRALTPPGDKMDNLDKSFTSKIAFPRSRESRKREKYTS
jgi:hypothetical protein